MKLKEIVIDPSSDKQRIVVVDDEKDIRTVVKMILNKAGFEVVEAANGLDGLAASLIYSPDLVLCDIDMPKMSGFEMLNLFKENPELVNIPFIFITGKKIETADMRKGMELGADDYLIKPFSNKELLSAVQTRLEKKNSLKKYYESQFDDIKSNIVHFLPHEFRSSLKMILGFSQLLIDMNKLPEEEVKEIGLKIYQSGWSLRHLLENVTLFGELEIWKHDQNKIAELRRDFVTLLTDFIPSIVEKETAKYDRPDALRIVIKNSPVQIAPVYLTKIVEEIIDNAFKFSKAGTFVHLLSEEHGSEVHIIVRDEGHGMSKDQINKITSFQQFDRNVIHQQGAGLGLVIAKTLAELHNGKLSIESEEDRGTTVKVSLPKAAKS